jgi:hypothetical protein
MHAINNLSMYKVFLYASGVKKINFRLIKMRFCFIILIGYIIKMKKRLVGVWF